MQVGYEVALKVFHRMKKAKTAPSMHPYYIMTDAWRNKQFRPKFFIYQQEEEIFYHGFHLSGVEGTGYYDIQSPYGYGGPISTCSDQEFLDGAWKEYDHWCLDNKVLAEFIRFHPLLDNWRYYPGNITENRETVWIDLYNKPLMPTYTSRARTAIRKAMKNGLNVEWWKPNSFLSVFPELYQRLMTKLNADEQYRLSDSYFEKLLRWNQVYSAVCLKEKEVLAGGIFLQNGAIMEYHLSASTLQGKELGATNLLLHEAALLGQRKGCYALHLGGGTDSSADNPLLFFKTSFSKNRAPFKIGTRIYCPEVYDRMKNDYMRKSKGNHNRFLFYR